MTGFELLAHRKRLGLTQTELAEHIGVHANTISAWERKQDDHIAKVYALAIGRVVDEATNREGGA